MGKKQLIIVKGSFPLRNAFVEDLKEAGLGSKLSYAFDPYQKSSNTVIIANHTVNGILAATEDIIKDNPPYKNATTYQLPEDYNKALQAFKDYFQEEVTFRVGDIVVFDVDSAIKHNDTSDVWNRSYILQVETVGNPIYNFLCFSNEEMKAAGMVFPAGGKCGNRIEHFRKATPEEVVKHKEQTLIYEAKKRGFVPGARYRRSHIDKSDKVLTIEFGKPEYNRKLDILYIDGWSIYKGGLWAEIAKETTLTLGSKDVLVTINKSGIYTKEQSFNIAALRSLYIQLVQKWQLSNSYSACIPDRDARIIRIGCSTHDNCFSISEIGKALRTYDDLYRNNTNPI